MKELKYFEILKRLHDLKSEQKGKSEISIRIFSNIIVHQLKEILEYGLRTNGVIPTIKMGNYDNIVQDAVSASKDEIIVIFWELANIIDGFQYKCAALENTKRKRISDKLRQELSLLFESLKYHKLVFFNLFHTSPFSVQLFNHDPYQLFANEANNWIGDHSPANFQFINLTPILLQLGFTSAFDLRNYHSSKALYTVEFFKAYVQNILPALLGELGKIKKVLVLDCDNTLWNGILGEDGAEGIKLSSKEKEGVAYEAVQYKIVELVKNGVLVCLCSKNNPEDVEDVLKNHPDMVLRGEHIISRKINWQDKASNIEELSKELNLGLDSFVFVDDSDFEVNWIHEKLPEVFVFQVPEKTYQYPVLFDEVARLFYLPSSTAKDFEKIHQYKTQRLRDELKVKANNIEDYIKSLHIKIQVYINEERLIPRMAQMTQKTNQFNLTTKRYSEQEIYNMMEDPAVDLFALNVSDKYGDSGITGLVIVKQENRKAVIDSLLMSCRIIGRNIEFCFLDEVIRQIRCDLIESTYDKSLKNAQVADFYEQMGFTVQHKTENSKRYVLEKDKYKRQTQYQYIQVINGKST